MAQSISMETMCSTPGEMERKDNLESTQLKFDHNQKEKKKKADKEEKHRIDKNRHWSSLCQEQSHDQCIVGVSTRSS